MHRDSPQQRNDRQRRRELDLADFDQLREGGLLQASLPVEYGGLWESRERSTRPLAELFRILAHGDSSIALVATMHHAVTHGGAWLAGIEVPAEYQPAWDHQVSWVVQTVLDGAWWGTVVSEPGSGGDANLTKSAARQDENGAWRISGLKHFGSGTGITSYMITEAVPDGESDRDRFIFDMRGVPLDGSTGVKLVAPWDGHGMTATQSHSMMFEDFPAQRSACPMTVLAKYRLPVSGNITWSAVILGIVEVAMESARRQLEKRASWRPFEQVEWSHAEVEAWLIKQAYEGILREAEQPGGGETLKGKTAIAELSESLLGRLCKILGGATYGRYSPFGFWFEDVRALGFLRPPWGLAFDTMFNSAWPAKQD